LSKADSHDYRPDVDGLRALAVIPVLLYHAKLGCSGGFVGVDIFFVISGFLISSLILKELGNGTFRLVTFWERRIRRILPALTVVVLASLAAGWFLYLPEDFELLGKSVIAQATLLSNVFFWRQGPEVGGYFAADSNTRTLLHTWSLAVEEQFYLLFPLLLIFLARRRRLSLPKTIAGLALGSFALSVVGSYSYPSATFYLLPTRAWELLLGALLAMMRGRFTHSGLAREMTGWLGLGLVCYPILCYDGATRFPGVGAVPPCLGAALIVFSSESQLSLVGRILTFPPLVFIGLISYSLYLWHFPVLVFSRCPPQGPQRVGLRIALLAASTVLAILTWRYVETPFRKRWILQKRPQIFGFAVGSMAMLLALGLFVYQRHGVPSRLSAKGLSYAKNRKHWRLLNSISLEDALAGRFVELGTHDTNQTISVLVWGDSHAMSVTPVLDDLCRRFSRRGIQATYGGTAPVLGYVSPFMFSLKEQSPAFAKAVLAFIAQKHVKNCVLAARWSCYPATDSAQTNLQTNLLLTVRAVMRAGARVYVLRDIPDQDFDLPRLITHAALYNGDLEKVGITREQHQMANRAFNQTFEQITQMGATVLDPADYFLNRNGLYGVVQNDQLLYWNGDHLTEEGSMVLAPLFEPIFRSQ
jgi:peptidoglycan/LPS O-acetylase OafA/YrhL